MPPEKVLRFQFPDRKDIVAYVVKYEDGRIEVVKEEDLEKVEEVEE